MLPRTKRLLRERWKEKLKVPKYFFEFLQVGAMEMHKVKITPELEKLYQEMYGLTNPKCGECKVPFSCCDKFTCEMVKEFAAEQGQKFELNGTDGMFLDISGRCRIPPHLRPLCTLHVCAINSNGCTSDLGWDKKYFELRSKIMERHNEC